ncbi:MAG: hypothetical protein E3J71_02220 [Candidatus Stahlbacteria bacterium]|nr:MAG: hypothetical protein E3J71_02220 [Candidatus Stahlbacteria bacterium]
MKRFVLFSGVALVVILFPQSILAGWTRTYGKLGYEVAHCVEQTSDGGYIVTGYAASCPIALLKTDEIGDTLWAHSYCEGRCVQQTSDGGYIVTGEVLMDDGKYHFSLVKTDSDGDLLWRRDDLNGVGYSVQQTSDGGYIITGHNSISLFEEIDDLWLIKTDSLGNTLWTRTYGAEGPDCGCCVRQTSDGGYIISGYSESLQSLWLLKTDEAGDTVWTQSSSGWVLGRGYCVQQTSDEGYILTGSIAPFYDGKNHLFLLKTDSTGDTLWSRIDIGWLSPAGGGVGRCIQQTPDDGYIITGYTSEWYDEIDDLWLIKTDSEGDTLWSRIYGGEAEDLGHCVDQTADGGYIITGATKSFGAGGYDLWLLKTDASGDTLDVVEEPPVTPVTHPSNWRLRASVGQQIVLQYSDFPHGFHAQVFDALGQKVDELHSVSPSGTLTWGEDDGCYSPGVYFIRSSSEEPSVTQKVILIK